MPEAVGPTAAGLADLTLYVALPAPLHVLRGDDAPIARGHLPGEFVGPGAGLRRDQHDVAIAAALRAALQVVDVPGPVDVLGPDFGNFLEAQSQVPGHAGPRESPIDASRAWALRRARPFGARARRGDARGRSGARPVAVRPGPPSPVPPERDRVFSWRFFPQTSSG